MNKKGKLLMPFILFFGLICVLSGCTVCKIISRGNQPIVLNALPQKYIVLEHFSKEKSFYFDYSRAPDLSAFIRESMVAHPDADAVINVFVTVKSSIGDFLMDIVTLTFARAYTLCIEGDIIRYANE